MENKKLSKQPIVELVCEFKFELEKQSDDLAFKLYDLIKSSFPVVNKRMPQINEKDNSKNGLQDVLLNFPINPITFFSNTEKTKVIQIGQNLFAINIIKNYEGWNKTKEIILKNYKLYLNEANPKSILSLSLRAINRFHFEVDKSAKVKLHQSFNFVPSAPKNIKEPITIFNMHIESLSKDKKNLLIVKNSTVLPDEDKKDQVSLLLDLTYLMNKRGELDFNDVEKWLDSAHEQLHNTFISCIKPKYLKELQ